jgi:DNA-directed RNA polymerase subunit RPC12/RpoP
MTLASRRFILQGALFRVACACAAVTAASAQTSPAAPGQKYVCPPCGCAADGKEFDAPGACPECGMPLIAKPAADPKGGGATPPKLSAATPKASRAANTSLASAPG